MSAGARKRSGAWKRPWAKWKPKMAREIEKLKVNLDATTTPLETIQVEALKKNIVPKACGLAWLPYVRKSQFELQEAWY